MQLQEAFAHLSQWRSEAQKHPEEEVFVFFDYCLRNLAPSKAQFFQDLFVLYELKEKARGFFVEFGAADGNTSSNTYLLEKEHKWKGILAEPSHLWPKILKKERKCALDFRCVWTTSGEQVEFNQVPDHDLSTISQFSECDMHAEARKKGIKYKVETVSLNDLLKQHSAPKSIDYISVDTEGSELDILKAFNFDAYKVKIFTIEHNYAPAREQIHALMTSKGYIRKFEMCSAFDDWYIKKP